MFCSLKLPLYICFIINAKTIEIMETLNNEQIIEKFIKAGIYINKVECKGRENGMICTIYNNYPLYHATYYTAYYYFNKRNLI